MPPSGSFSLVVAPSDADMRLDVFVAHHVSALTRSQAATLIQDGKITVNRAARKPGYRVRSKDKIVGEIPPPQAVALEPEPLALDVIYEDDQLMAVNKPPGMVVHPAPGHASGTLVNALLYRCPDIGPIGGELRPGIVHRLDKDTSGILLVAKTAAAHAHLSAQFASRSIQKVYVAIVFGSPASDGGTIALPIGRHQIDRKRMAVGSRRARPAETRWKVRERFEGLTVIELDLKTGRTHQARVHCAALNHPIVGDPVYAGRKRIKLLPETTAAIARSIRRQMLHAWQLTCTHPMTTKTLHLEAPLPLDIVGFLDHLRRVSGNR